MSRSQARRNGAQNKANRCWSCWWDCIRLESSDSDEEESSSREERFALLWASSCLILSFHCLIAITFSGKDSCASAFPPHCFLGEFRPSSSAECINPKRTRQISDWLYKYCICSVYCINWPSFRILLTVLSHFNVALCKKDLLLVCLPRYWSWRAHRARGRTQRCSSSVKRWISTSRNGAEITLHLICPQRWREAQPTLWWRRCRLMSFIPLLSCLINYRVD